MNKLKSSFLTIFIFTSLNIWAQSPYKNDRVYTGNQVSNTVSVVDPSQNKLLGEIKWVFGIQQASLQRVLQTH